MLISRREQLGGVDGAHELDVAVALDELDELLEHQQAAGTADVLRVHGEDEGAAVAVQALELRGPGAVDLVRVAHGAEAVGHRGVDEVRRIVRKQAVSSPTKSSGCSKAAK